MVRGQGVIERASSGPFSHVLLRVASIVRSIVEVFTFFQMGGELQRVDIVPLGAAIDFNRFAVEQAKCFDANDKAKLLTAIESAFGAYGPFNAIVRQLLTSASGDEPAGGTAHKRRRSSASKHVAGSAQEHPRTVTV